MTQIYGAPKHSFASIKVLPNVSISTHKFQKNENTIEKEKEGPDGNIQEHNCPVLVGSCPHGYCHFVL